MVVFKDGYRGYSETIPRATNPPRVTRCGPWSIINREIQADDLAKAKPLTPDFPALANEEKEE